MSGGGSFARRGGVLHCGPCSLSALAEEHGTPLYVYGGGEILDRLAALRRAFAPLNPLVAYSAKANSSLAVLDLLARHGAGADIVSGGELHRCLRAGVPPGRIVFAGVGKTVRELEQGLEAEILSFHVESAHELAALASAARRAGRPAPFAVRVNPGVLSPTHEYTQTGHATAKFGVPPEEAVQLYREVREDGFLEPVGVCVHVGSQVRQIRPFRDALETVVAVAERCRREAGVRLRYADLGGGFAVAGPDGPGLDLAELGGQAVRLVAGSGLSLVVEPGRALVGGAGVLLTRVLHVKRSGGKTFVVVDAGMTDFVRPTYYGAAHAVEFVDPAGHGPPARVDVVGPVCESGDFLALDRRLPLPGPGELLCLRTAGAYGFSMASNYNSRPRPAEVMVHDGAACLVRARESYEDLVRGERAWHAADAGAGAAQLCSSRSSPLPSGPVADAVRGAEHPPGDRPCTSAS